MEGQAGPWRRICCGGRACQLSYRREEEDVTAPLPQEEQELGQEGGYGPVRQPRPTSIHRIARTEGSAALESTWEL